MAKSDAPNYRESTNPDKICSNCRFAKNKTSIGGRCTLYDFNYEKGYVCDSWKPVKVKGVGGI